MGMEEKNEYFINIDSLEIILNKNNIAEKSNKISRIAQKIKEIKNRNIHNRNIENIQSKYLHENEDYKKDENKEIENIKTKYLYENEDYKQDENKEIENIKNKYLHDKDKNYSLSENMKINNSEHYSNPKHIKMEIKNKENRYLYDKQNKDNGENTNDELLDTKFKILQMR